MTNAHFHNEIKILREINAVTKKQRNSRKENIPEIIQQEFDAIDQTILDLARKLFMVLYNRRILYLDVMELEWIHTSVIDHEAFSLPRLNEMPPQITKLLETLENLGSFQSWFNFGNHIRCNYYTQIIDNLWPSRTMEEDKIVNYMFDTILHYCDLFESKLEENLESDAGDAHKEVHTSFDQILQYLVEIRTWGIHLLGQIEGHQGLHIEVFGMRQAKHGLFLFSNLDSFLLPNTKSSVGFQCMAKPIETMIRLA
ncbi:9745_t:CDS:2, partial [Entrophospora sp. SA101]